MHVKRHFLIHFCLICACKMYRLQDELDKARAVAKALDSNEIDARARTDRVLNQQ